MVRLCGLTGAVAAGVFTGDADDVGELGADGGLHGNLIASDPGAAWLPFSWDWSSGPEKVLRRGVAS